MGKVRIIPNISYESNNLGKLSGINVNISSGKAIIIPNVSFASNNLGQVEFLGNESGDEFKITALENLTISFSNNLEYKYDANTWDLWETYTANETLQIDTSKSIIFRGDLTPNENTGIGTFAISGNCTVSGNLLSLINYGNISNYAFKYLFKDCTYLLNAEDLILPNTTTISCYEGMFKNCSSLETAPILHATTLTSNCYKELFYNCESLDYIEIESTTLLGEDYSLNWVYNVASEGEFKQPTNISNEFGVNAIPTGWTTAIDYSQMYFTIESLQDSNEIKMQRSNTPNNPILSYSLDDGETWTTTTISGTKSFGTINIGQKIIFKGNNKRLAYTWNTYNYFTATKQFKVYGNIMSLLNGDDFITNSEFQTGTSFQFAGLLRTTYLVDASNLILPATTLYESSYNGMFRGSTNLVYGPKLLPALDVPHDAYSSLFEGCTSLVEAPEILATTVSGDGALNRMFCMSRNSKVTAAMTKGPILRITNPAAYANVYQQLFCGNGSLTEVTIITQGTNLSFADWLNYTNSGVIKKLSTTTLTSGANGVPSGWTTEDYVESNS